MTEIWKDIKEYEGKYQISNTGKVRSLVNNKNKIRKQPKILKPYLDKDGYEIVRLSKNSKLKAFKIHRLVAIYFLDNVKNKLAVDHIDTNRRNNNYTNLRWVTNEENSNNLNTISNLKKIGVKYKIMYGKPIVDKNGNRYISIIEASRELKISRSKIQYHLKNNTGEWMYV